MKIKIRHPNPKIPPLPKSRDEMLKEWANTIRAIYNNTAPKTFEEFEAHTEKLKEEEAKLAIKYSFEDSYDNFDIENILKTYGPVTISLCEDGDILAITQEEYRP